MAEQAGNINPSIRGGAGLAAALQKSAVNGRAPLSSPSTPAREIFGRLADDAGLKSAGDIFRLPRNERNAFLLKFADEAEKAGHTDLEIARTILAYTYANRLRIWKNTSTDQAPSSIVCANTGALDWFKRLEGYEARIEDGVLFNGIFGHRHTVESAEEARKIDDLTHILYILNHGLENNNPLPAYIIVGGRSRTRTSFEVAVEHARARYEKLVEDSTKTANMIHNTHLDVENPKTGERRRVPIIGMIYEKQNGTFYVVDFSVKHGEKTDAATWLGRKDNIARLLSVTVEELARLERDVFPALLGKSWKEKLALAPEHAQLAQSYETIMRNRENLASAQNNRGDIRINALFNSVRKHACVDSRQSGHTKSLGAVSPVDEMISILKKDDVSELQITPHLKCGYIGAVIALHQLGNEIQNAINHRAENGGEVKELQAFLVASMQKLFTSDRVGPLAERDVFDQHMGVLDIAKDTQLYNALLGVFVLPDQLMRNVLRSAYAAGDMKWSHVRGVHMVPYMVAAHRVDALIAKFGCKDEITASQYSALVTEEIGREMLAKVNLRRDNMPELGSKAVSLIIEEFGQGRQYLIPKKPRTRDELLDMEREDAFLGTIRNVDRMTIEMEAYPVRFVPEMLRA